MSWLELFDIGEGGRINNKPAAKPNLLFNHLIASSVVAVHVYSATC